MAMTRTEAQKFVEALIALRKDATDATASTSSMAYPTLKEDNSLVIAGTRINWNGGIKRAAVDLWDTVENNPENAPTLWEDLEYIGGYRIIPETITVGTAFAQGERGWWKYELYESLLAANTYTPEQYAAGWQKI